MKIEITVEIILISGIYYIKKNQSVQTIFHFDNGNAGASFQAAQLPQWRPTDM